MSKKVAILDYGIGNVKSISNAFKEINAKTILTFDPSMILNADAVVLPGVGAFEQGMNNLKSKDLDLIVNEFLLTGRPFLGICLGMQMLLEESDEFGTNKGLGLIEGKVRRLKLHEGSTDKLPHVSWNEISKPQHTSWSNSLLNNIQNESDVYFVHSYVAIPDNHNAILATSNYGGVEFCSAVKSDNIMGVQFHPEKSGVTGLNILRNFINL